MSSSTSPSTLLRSRSIPLRWLLVVPFVLQITGIVGLVGYISFRSGQQSINDVARQLRNEVTLRVQQRLESYLSTPVLINHINVDAAKEGWLRLDDTQSEKHLWRQLSWFKEARWIYYGDEKTGGHVVGRRSLKGEFEVGGANPANKNFSHFYKAKPDGSRGELVETGEKRYDARTRPWYQAAIAAKQPAWSPIYVGFSSKQLTLTACEPVYNAAGQLQGVAAVDMFLADISRFLSQVKIGQQGRVFIIERSTGLLVANSTPEQPYVTGADGKPQRIAASASQNPLVQATGKFLSEQFQDLNQIQQTQLLSFKQADELQFVQVTPLPKLDDAAPLDWLIVVVVPESDFLQQIRANRRTTALLCLVALVLAIVLSIFTSRVVVRSLLELNRASEAIADGDLSQSMNQSSIRELNRLGTTFNRMASQLRDSFLQLGQTNEQLGAANQQLAERTQKLEHALVDLKQSQAQLIQSEKMSSLGQLVAGIAHEINNPVSFIQGNLVPANTYIQDLLELIQLYQTECQNPSDNISRKIEEIELDFLMEDLPKLWVSLKVGADRIRDIVLSLRTFSRSDEADLKTVNIHDGIDSTLMILKSRTKAQEFRPAIDIIKTYADLPLVECYPGPLNQVLMNLLVNAIDALDEQAEKRSYEQNETDPRSIQIVTVALDKTIQVSILDNGIGMSEETQSKIFDPFFTTKPIGKGTGLGMAICYQIIVERHGGQLRCDSILGEGSKFTVEIPIQQSRV
ncbi:MAG: sensor histidine kinase [Oculatellaceae cyanobacterium Prado106]|nr:sensor histidine kinase [Oculatellaceae cyanobacterium Prado106]